MLDISGNYLDEDDQEGNSSSDLFESRSVMRVQTAPARPLTDLEEFKRSPEFLLLESAVFSSQQLVQKTFQKYELDSQEGQKRCRKFLQYLEKLCDAYSVKLTSKDYRNKFSKAYQILYKDNANYLTEILDSAQEGFPYLWVNGEKYIFSTEVLDTGSRLLSQFLNIQNILKNQYKKLCQENDSSSVEESKIQIVKALEDFDKIWSKFEQLYVTELMIIENDARRFITEAIEVEKDLQSIEIREKLKGRIVVQNPNYHRFRKKLVKIISQINAVANFEGKGRDDLQFEILLEAEGLVRRITKEQSKSVLKLAEKIRNAFIKLRKLFTYYESNIETIPNQKITLIQWKHFKIMKLPGKRANTTSQTQRSAGI